MIPDQIRSEVKSPAERRLYEMFRVQLSDEWTVFHHVPWQVRDLRGGARDGEADFVIAHPEHGLLVLEVKGGNIRYDGEIGRWYSNNYQIKDPFDQVRDCMYSLLRVLQEQPYWHSRWITMGYAVAFPDVIVAQHMLRPDAPRNIIMDMSQARNATQWLIDVLRYYSRQERSDEVLGQFGIKTFSRQSPTT